MSVDLIKIFLKYIEMSLIYFINYYLLVCLFIYFLQENILKYFSESSCWINLINSCLLFPYIIIKFRHCK